MDFGKYKQLIDENLEIHTIKDKLKYVNKEIFNNESNITFINTEKLKSITDTIELKNNELRDDIRSLSPNLLEKVQSVK